MRPVPIWLAVALLALAALFVHRRGGADLTPPSEPLSHLPIKLGQWQGSDQPISQEALDLLGNGFFLNRIYQPLQLDTPSPAATSVPVSLLIGYFPTQRTGSTIHSPQNCLPGAGWTFDSKGLIDLSFGAGKQIEVGDYLVSNGPVKLEVFYWYQTQGKAIASDYKARAQLMVDSIRYRRSDAALIRLVTPLQENETRDAARNRIKAFAGNFLPLLPRYVPN